MRNLIAILILILIGFVAYRQIIKPHWMETGDGFIEHTDYGKYPAEIPYQEGMTIMPGQSAVLELRFESDAPHEERR